MLDSSRERERDNMATTTFLSDGLMIRGEFLRLGETKAYVGKDGVQRTPARVIVVTGGGTLAVEYGSYSDALVALGGSEPKRLDVVELQVWAQGAWNNETNRRGSVFYRGLLPREEARDSA